MKVKILKIIKTIDTLRAREIIGRRVVAEIEMQFIPRVGEGIFLESDDIDQSGFTVDRVMYFNINGEMRCHLIVK